MGRCARPDDAVRLFHEYLDSLRAGERLDRVVCNMFQKTDGVGPELARALCAARGIDFDAAWRGHGGGVGNAVGAGAELFVGGLDYGVGEAELVRAFSPHGAVHGVHIPMDRESGRPRGFAFVRFGSAPDAERAARAMDGTSLRGRRVNVQLSDDRRNGGWHALGCRSTGLS